MGIIHDDNKYVLISKLTIDSIRDAVHEFYWNSGLPPTKRKVLVELTKEAFEDFRKAIFDELVSEVRVGAEVFPTMSPGPNTTTFVTPFGYFELKVVEKTEHGFTTFKLKL